VEKYFVQIYTNYADLNFSATFYVTTYSTLEKLCKSILTSASAEKIPQEGEATEKRPKNNKKIWKIALLSLYIYTMYENPGLALHLAADAHGY